jgi:hypothetical protein
MIGGAAVLDDDRLAQFGGQLGADQARDHVHGAAGRIGHHQGHGAFGVGGRRGAGRAGKQSGRGEHRAAARQAVQQMGHDSSPWNWNSRNGVSASRTRRCAGSSIQASRHCVAAG